MAAWAQAAAPALQAAQAAAAWLDEAYAAWDAAIAVIDAERSKQMAPPGVIRPSRSRPGGLPAWPLGPGR